MKKREIKVKGTAQWNEEVRQRIQRLIEIFRAVREIGTLSE